MLPYRRALTPPPSTGGLWASRSRAGQIVRAGFFAPLATGGLIKAWTGAAWASRPVKVWLGSAWVQKPLKRWNGSAWVMA